MVRAGITCVGEFDYVHHSEALIAAARRRPASGSRCSTRATSRAGSASRSSGAQARFSDGDAARWAERVSAHRGRARSAPRSTPSAPCPPSRWTRRRVGARAGRCTSTSPSSAPRTRPASPPTACTPVQLLAEHGALGPNSTAVHATHLTDARPGAARRRRRSACARRPSATSPTASATPARTSASAATATRSSTSSRRRARSSSTCGSKTERRGHFTAQALLRGATNHALPRLARRRPDRARRARRPRHGRPRVAAAGDRRTGDDARVDRLRRHRRRRDADV